MLKPYQYYAGIETSQNLTSPGSVTALGLLCTPGMGQTSSCVNSLLKEPNYKIKDTSQNVKAFLAREPDA